MPSLTDKKKLCPRCGSPMMTQSETVKICPVCHYTQSSAKVEIKIKMDETEKEAKLADLEIYKITASGRTKASNLESENAYVIVDRKGNILWMWKGAKCSPGDAYKAGVATTKLKSELRMYSASIKQVEEGDEPDNFPSIEQVAPIAESEQKEEEERRREAERKQKEEEERKKREDDIRRQQEAVRRKQVEEEERRRKEGIERRQKEEIERKQKEEEKRKQEEERRIKEELEREKQAEIKPPEITSDIWKKVAGDTKTVEESKKIQIPTDDLEDDDLSQAISSLTLVRGINEELARVLYKANVSTIMELALSNPEELSAASGIQLSNLKELIGNAKDILGLD